MATIAELLNNKNLINDNKQNNSNKGNNFNKPKVKIKSDYGLSSSKKQSGGFVYNSSNQHKAQGTNNFNGNKQKPTAPYNFVRLNDKVIQPPLAEFILNNKDKKTGYKDFMASGEKYSGYFDVEIKNITPLYIGGADGAFSDGKNCCIPGSSLRGCLKNIFKIITNGNMKINENPDITDRTLYFRSFASGYKKFRELYSNRMTQDKTVISKGEEKTIKVSISQAGFLVKQNKQYFICPASFTRQKGIGIDKTVIWRNDCVEVYTGKMDTKKHFYRINSPRWNEKYVVHENIVKSYEDDKSRNKMNLLNNRQISKNGRDGLKILKGAEAYDYIVPCFYVAENGVVSHFGAGPYYRIPYINSIGDHVPDKLKKSGIDFADAVFGCKEAWGSRVFFEDLFMDNQNKANFISKNYMKPLMTPNPTSFQSYLEADENNDPQHWDIEAAQIRGYKLYWHKQPKWVVETDKGEKINDKFNKQIAPLKEDQHFYGRIRFENLDKTELGALAKLFEIGAEKNCCYKLGMGKPYGLGSVELKGKLYIKNKDCYTKLFDDNGFYSGYTEVVLEDFTSVFDDYMQQQLGNSVNLYNERIKELKILMSTEQIDNPGWNRKTQYIGITGRTKDLVNDRIVLPSAEEVFKK